MENKDHDKERGVPEPGAWDSLPKDNFWVKLADRFPWDRADEAYRSVSRNAHGGNPGLPSRRLLGVLVVKHSYGLSDADAVGMVVMCPPLQYLCGYDGPSNDAPLNPSTLTRARHRLGMGVLDRLTRDMDMALGDLRGETGACGPREGRTDARPPSGEGVAIDAGLPHEGDVFVDATVCDAEMKYPTDVGLLHDGIRAANEVIDAACGAMGIPRPATLMDESRRVFLDFSKNKAHRKEKARECIGTLIGNLKNDMGVMDGLLAGNPGLADRLTSRHRRLVDVVHRMCDQQEGMLVNGGTCEGRILSVSQEFVRMIMRGKIGRKYERGAKVNVAIHEGMAYVDRLAFENFNESEHVGETIRKYVERFGCLPERFFADRIYMTRVNIRYLESLGVQPMGLPLARSAWPKDPSPEYRERMRVANSLRQRVEGMFGLAKRVYRLNNVRAKRPDTQATWIALCFFAANVKTFMRETDRLAG